MSKRSISERDILEDSSGRSFRRKLATETTNAEQEEDVTGEQLGIVSKAHSIRHTISTALGELDAIVPRLQQMEEQERYYEWLEEENATLKFNAVESEDKIQELKDKVEVLKAEVQLKNTELREINDVLRTTLGVAKAIGQGMDMGTADLKKDQGDLGDSIKTDRTPGDQYKIELEVQQVVTEKVETVFRGGAVLKESNQMLKHERNTDRVAFRNVRRREKGSVDRTVVHEKENMRGDTGSVLSRSRKLSDRSQQVVTSSIAQTNSWPAALKKDHGKWIHSVTSPDLPGNGVELSRCLVAGRPDDRIAVLAPSCISCMNLNKVCVYGRTVGQEGRARPVCAACMVEEKDCKFPMPDKGPGSPVSV